MITWMQKHRKYLVITIWISTIAFVGAGFVGWGSYDYGSMGGGVAKVGKIDITKEEYSSTYGNIYNYYSKMTGGKLDEQTAKSLNIENMALQTLVNQALLQNFANELELRVTDEEVASKLASMEPFQKGGKFDKDTYMLALKNIGMNPKAFEEGLKKELLMEKVYGVLQPKVHKEEAAALATAALSKDRVGIKIINAAGFLKPASEGEIKNFWEKNKAKFKTEPSYDLESIEVPSFAIKPSDEDMKKEYAENGSLYFKDGKKMSFEEAKEFISKNAKLKIAKKDALKKYVELKEGKLNGKSINGVTVSAAAPLPNEIKSELLKTKQPSTLKPILVNDMFVVLKVVKIVPSKDMSFEEAKPIAKMAVERDNAINAMKAEAEKALQGDFTTVDVGFLSKNEKNSIAGLSEQETSQLSSAIFESKEPKGAVYLSSKTVLFKVLEQKLLDKEQATKDEQVFSKLLLGAKASLVNQSVLEYLKNRYEVKLFMRPNGENDKK